MFLFVQTKKKSLIFHKKTCLAIIVVVISSLILVNPINPLDAQPTPKPTPAPQGFTMNQYGMVNWVTIYSGTDGKACVASVAIENTQSNWVVSAADQSICDLFGKAKEGNKRVFMLGDRMQVASLPPIVRSSENIPANYCCLFKIVFLRMQ
jgi:hypothetical protein